VRNTEHRRELLHLLAATAAFGAAGGIFAATLNNFLAEVHGFGAEARGWLEFPRELPGFLLVGVTGLLALWMRESRMAALAMLASALGALGLRLAREGGEGRRLGQLGGARNLGTISDVGIIHLLAKLGGNETRSSTCWPEPSRCWPASSSTACARAGVSRAAAAPSCAASADITPSISLGITIDHAVAMTLPLPAK